MNLTKYHYSAIGSWIILSCGCAQFKQAETIQPPNIVFILADDLGITDVAAFASYYTGMKTSELFYETPHIDKLISKGIVFSQAYANPLCSPTRAAIMSGQNPARVGFTTATPLTKTYFNQNLPAPKGHNKHDAIDHKDPIKEQQAWLNGKSNTGLDPALTTLPEVLDTHYSAFIGKWHLGGHGVQELQPRAHGFHESPAWFDSGASLFFQTKSKNRISWPNGWDDTKAPYGILDDTLFDVGDIGESPHAGYLTDDLTNRAVNFIENYSNNKTPNKKPFFLYMSHFAVHAPIQAPAELVKQFERKSQRGTLGHNNATYAAMVKNLDDSVGRLIAVLKQTGLAENTLVVFTSDNGGTEYTKPAATDNAPFKGGKATMYEGGVRVPLVYYMPGKYEGGTWCDQVVSSVDHLPTLAKITGNTVPDDIDGLDITDILSNPGRETIERTLIWHYPFNVKVKHPNNNLPLTPHSGMRKGDYKLLWDWHGKVELYNIIKDPYENVDLTGELPELKSSMINELQDWLQNNVKQHYMPKRNPAYNVDKDKRPYPFIDLSRTLTNQN